MPFLAPGFLPRPSIPLDKKIKICSSEVRMSFLLSRDIGKTYKFVYTLNILTKEQRLDPQIRISSRMIDMISLRNAILSNVNFYDKKYMNLVKFDTRVAEFHFDVNKWLDDALRSVNPRTEYSKFSRTFRFKARLPNMILLSPLPIFFEEFLIRHFKKYMELKRKPAKWFKYLLPEELRKRYRAKVSNMFEYSYDIQWNVMVLTLKTLYIMAILFAVGIAGYKITKSKIQGQVKQKEFATKVKANITKFDRRKWEKFVRTRRI